MGSSCARARRSRQHGSHKEVPSRTAKIQMLPRMALLADALEVGKGDIDETVRLLEEAYRLDPLDVNVIAFLGRAYFYAGREAEAPAHWDKTSSLAAFRASAPPL